MTKLSDTQAIILAAAAQRPDGNILPLPARREVGRPARSSARCLLTLPPDTPSL
jgi:hypothetical protein